MPDELATRATLLLMGGIVAGLVLAPLVAWLWRLATGRPSGKTAGAVAGLGIFAAAMSVVTADLGRLAHEQQSWLSVPGLLLGFEARKLRESRGGRKLVGRGAVVEFDLPDGTRHAFLGLSGSQTDEEVGAAVPVRVDPARPERAVIDDFQSRFGALWLFATLAGVAWLMVAQTLAAAWADGRPPPTGAWARWRDGESGQAWSRMFRRAGQIGVGLAIIGLFVAAEYLSVLGAFGVCFAGLAAASACFGVATLLKPGVHWQGLVFGALATAAAVVSAAAWLRLLSPG